MQSRSQILFKSFDLQMGNIKSIPCFKMALNKRKIYLQKDLADVGSVLHSRIELVQLKQGQVRLQVVADLLKLAVNIPEKNIESLTNNSERA